MSRRTERLGSTIQREIAMMILRDLSDPRIKLAPSVTRVEVTEDLEFADVYVTVMGTAGEKTAALNALKHAAGMMRAKLSKMLDIRTTPFLRFHYDDAQKKELEMLELLHKIELERKEKEAADAAKAAETPEGPVETADGIEAPKETPAAPETADSPRDHDVT